MKNENVWKTYGEKELQELHAVNEKYKKCLDAGKTERECVTLAIKMAEEAGYRDVKEVLAAGKPLVCGDKVYANYMGKALALLRMGEKPISAGMNILGAHIDSPRIDIKQNPLYENEEFAYLDTHYYGGIKKYQWVAGPMALHGVVAKKDGSIVEIVIGEKEEDPVLVITDLLIHLAKEQLEKKASVVIEGERLDVLVGNRPLKDVDKNEKEAVKANLLQLLKESYDIEEADFLSAELELVPAGKARDCGLDRSMVLAYGQDDRVCAFTSLFAMLEVEHTERASCCLLVDKEEIGSVGATGMHSRAFENTVAELIALNEGESELKTRPRRWRIPVCCHRMSAQRTTHPLPMRLKNAAPRSSRTAFLSTNLREAAAKAAPMTRTRNISRICARSSIGKAWRINSQSLERWISAAAERLPISWRITAWKSSTAA